MADDATQMITYNNVHNKINPNDLKTTKYKR